MDGLGDGGSRKVEHGGGVVGVLDDRVEALARLDGLGVPDEEGHAHGLFVHPTLVLVVVLAKHETLVAGVDDQGVVHLTGFFEVLEESTQVVVDALHATEKFLEVCVVGQACVLFVGVVCGVVVCGEFLREASGQITQVGPARVAVADRGADVRDQFILVSPGRKRSELGMPGPESIRFRDVQVGQIGFVALGIFEVVVRCLVVVHEEEGLVLFAVLEPVERKVGDGVGGVLVGKLDQVFAPRLVSPHPEGRAVVFPLSRQNAVVIEVLGLHLEVPFADHGRLVTGFAHFDGEHLLARHDPSAQVDGAVDVVVLSGQDAGPGGRADGVGAKSVLKGRPPWPTGPGWEWGRILASLPP